MAKIETITELQQYLEPLALVYTRFVESNSEPKAVFFELKCLKGDDQSRIHMPGDAFRAAYCVWNDIKIVTDYVESEAGSKSHV